jgi:DNA-binding GntR family transcriptional regulator
VYTAADTKISRRELAYQSLKHQLLRGDFAPGERLGEERLADALHVSRTPVREALTRLHSDGLVERLPDGGYGPTIVDLHLVRELYEVRFALEAWAVRRDHDAEQLDGLRADWSVLEAPATDDDLDPDFVLLDEDFHERLAAATGNDALVSNLRSVNERIRIVRMHDFLLPERIAETIEEHVGIVDALLGGDRALGEQRLTAHFDESLAVVEERAALALARMMRRRDR